MDIVITRITRQAHGFTVHVGVDEHRRPGEVEVNGVPETTRSSEPPGKGFLGIVEGDWRQGINTHENSLPLRMNGDEGQGIACPGVGARAGKEQPGEEEEPQARRPAKAMSIGFD
ncbi:MULTISPECIES: hypothetical protein [Hydrogenophaga]|uniref:hypothetical protein n=1 Tax=Hydrogenophaga TaxID=47420 RepID=UPI00110D7505|nr:MULTISPECIES: hypothetical protein [Hydrogenophaga]TMU74085.1 hypothetical protein FGJ01_15245 [Hydrogenophaga intermedia]